MGRDRARAAAAYEELLSKYPDNTRALNDLCYIYGQRRDYARAETLYRRIPAAAIAQFHRPQWNPNLVNALFDQGKTAAAESALVAANRTSPRAPQRFSLAIPIIQASFGLERWRVFSTRARATPTRSRAPARRAFGPRSRSCGDSWRKLMASG
jgi:tetratricopeptide (TPR) repeat protein